MPMTEKDILARLANMSPIRTADLPDNQVGIYALIDHEGQLRYIGSTSANDESFYKRIHHRHRTGSETYSHYFSKVYNCGRMWRDRKTQQKEPDAKIAKALRSAFIATHCRAVFVPLAGSRDEIQKLEAAVIKAAPSEWVRWNGSSTLVYSEPLELVDQMINQLGFGRQQREAVERQQRLYQAYVGK
jgi:hypothetical protein